MTRTTFWLVAASVMILAGSAVLISCTTARAADADGRAATQPSAAADDPAGLWHAINFEIGDHEFYNGDDIKITSVRCSAEKLGIGEVIEVKGTYDLHTAAEASLDLFFTATDGNGTSSNQPEQVSTVHAVTASSSCVRSSAATAGRT